MNPEEIKVGDFVNLKLLVTGIISPVVSIHKDYTLTLELPSGSKYVLRECDFEALSPANGSKNAETSTETPEKEALFAPLKKLESLPPNFPHPETAPKYDPCRKFREGDIVEPCQVKGRWLSEGWKNRKGIHYKVTSDEDDDCVMWVLDPDSHHRKYVVSAFFQLVTPVEDLEPYFIEKSGNGYRLMKRNGKLLANYWETHPHAKAAAVAESDRLNAEYRKGQKNA